ncbi:unnamed protein product [Prunus armeniaca]
MEGEYAGVITFMKWCAEMIRHFISPPSLHDHHHSVSPTLAKPIPVNNGHNGQIRVDLLPSDSIYFIVGIINKKLDVNQFQNVHSCRSGLSDSCLRSLKRGIQGFFQLSVSGLLFYWSCSHVDEQLHMDL